MFASEAVAVKQAATEFFHSQFSIRAHGSPSSEDEKATVLFCLLGTDVTRSHFCTQKKAHLKHVFVHLGLDMSTSIKYHDPIVHLCVSSQAAAATEDPLNTASVPCSAAASTDTKTWFYVGKYKHQSGSFGGVRGDLGSKHVLIDHTFVPTRFNIAERSKFMEYSTIDPFLNCPLSRYGVSICDPGQGKFY